MAPTSRQSHHHGNLREVLLEAALTHVRRDGAASFSLRDATSAAGVTSGAAYRHFATRAQLLDHVVVRGFVELSTSMNHAVRTVSDTTINTTKAADKLLRTGHAYVDFAKREPHLFALMFGPDGATGRHRARTSDLGAPSASDQVRAALRETGASDDTTFLLAWGLAHGLAGLAAAGIATDAAVEASLAAFADSLANAAFQQPARHAKQSPVVGPLRPGP